MRNKYLIRLDDACPTMNHKKWNKMLSILEKYGIRPMIGIIPNNEDPKQKIDAPDANFWYKAKQWQKKGYAIALHGYNHCYISNEGLKGINPLWARSEFAGVPLEIQKQKIQDGINVLLKHEIIPQYFFAPSHTFDKNTLIALKCCSPIRIISDTIATKPYCLDNFVIIPQLGGHCTEMNIKGVWTFCLHPSMMTDENFEKTEKFFIKHKNEFIGFDELDFKNIKKKDWFSKLLSWIYFTRRKIKGIK